jgi:HEAT repeat protein
LRKAIRSAVITAIGYVGWEAFKSLLESLQQSDPDSQVRKDAEVMLSDFELYVSNTVIAS